MGQLAGVEDRRAGAEPDWAPNIDRRRGHCGPHSDSHQSANARQPAGKAGARRAVNAPTDGRRAPGTVTRWSAKRTRPEPRYERMQHEYPMLGKDQHSCDASTYTTTKRRT